MPTFNVYVSDGPAGPSYSFEDGPGRRLHGNLSAPEGAGLRRIFSDEPLRLVLRLAGRSSCAIPASEAVDAAGKGWEGLSWGGTAPSSPVPATAPPPPPERPPGEKPFECHVYAYGSVEYDPVDQKLEEGVELTLRRDHYTDPFAVVLAPQGSGIQYLPDGTFALAVPGEAAVRGRIFLWGNPVPSTVLFTATAAYEAARSGEYGLSLKQTEPAPAGSAGG